MQVRPALINVMAKAAEKAAKGLVRDFGEVENLQISRKGPSDFVSNADLKAQKILREELSKARPSFGFLMEEKDGGDDRPNISERWVVDPLDGTTNFLHGMPHWAVSIAAEREGEMVAGLIYNPAADEMFWAEKGLGAYLNNRRLRVSARKHLSECLVSTGIPFKGREEYLPSTLKRLEILAPQIAGVRRLGAASLDLAYVAAGRNDAYFEDMISLWDIAAGAVIVREAGGFIAPLEEGKDALRDASIIATNAEIHDQIVRILRSV